MIRALVPSVLALSCAACATAGEAAKGRSYQLDPGTADYDSLQRATALCNSRGGSLVPRKDADLTELSDYSCVIPKAK